MIELLLFAILCVLFPPLFYFLVVAAVFIGAVIGLFLQAAAS